MTKTLRMKDVVKKEEPDFRIKYELLGKTRLSFFPGCILNFAYQKTPDVEETFYDIFPEFYRGVGSSMLVESGENIPKHGVADMWIVSEKNKIFHHEALYERRVCYLFDGTKVVAKCRILKVSNELKKSQLQLKKGS